MLQTLNLWSWLNVSEAKSLGREVGLMHQQVVGTSIPRVEGTDKVTGTLKYTGDRNWPGMIHAKLLRSEHARAEIVGYTLREAERVAGVVEVVTAADLPQPIPRFGSVVADQPLLADKEVKYHGEPVAVVMALEEEAAVKALSAVKVLYRPLSPVVTIEEALQPGAPLVHQHAMGHNGMICMTNVYGVWNYYWGDVRADLNRCSQIIENTYTFPMVHHFPLERYTCLAYPDGGGVIIHSPIQHPFILRRVVAATLGLPLTRIRIVAGEIGGGFGGKGYAKVEPLAAYLALRTRRAVKFTLSTEEGFLSARRTAASVHIKTGYDDKGLIVFQEIDADYLMGAYVDVAPRVIAKASYLACGPYKTPNARITARAIYSNTVPSTAMRGFGTPQLCWALELQMNEAARRLGLDPLEIRVRNLPEKGQDLVPGDAPVDGHWVSGLHKAAEAVGWSQPLEPGRGRNIAIGIKSPIPASVSNAVVRLHADGSVTVVVGTTEMGQGARTVLAQIASDILEIPVERVTVLMGDTAAAPFDLCTAASRSTVTMGTAVTQACRDILSQLRNMAKELIGREEEEVVISGGLVNACGKVMPYPELLTEYMGPTQGDVIGKGTFKGTRISGHPLGGLADFWEVVFTGAQVRVDPENGQVVVEKLVNVSDVGKVINPLQAEGQEDGGAVLALGHTLLEQMIYSMEGKLLNGNPLDYCIPTAMDVPLKMESSFIENEDGPGPFGAKGLGESTAIAVAPAVAGAIENAVGVVIRDLPLTPERVWRAIQKEKGG